MSNITHINNIVPINPKAYSIESDLRLQKQSMRNGERVPRTRQEIAEDIAIRLVANARMLAEHPGSFEASQRVQDNLIRYAARLQLVLGNG